MSEDEAFRRYYTKALDSEVLVHMTADPETWPQGRWPSPFGSNEPNLSLRATVHVLGMRVDAWRLVMERATLLTRDAAMSRLQGGGR